MLPRMFRPFAAAFASLLFLSTTTSCGGDTHESLGDETVALMKEALTILEGITDKASAEAAKPRLEALGAKGDDLEKRMSALGTPDAATQERMRQRMAKEMGETQGRLMTVMSRLMSDPEISAALGETMGKLDLGR